jgi:SNF2 family DNA or RNA helicase
MFFDRVWGLGVNLQAEDRVTGMRQTKESTIMPLCLKDTIDTNLELKVLPRKKLDADKVQDGVDITKDSYGVQDLIDLMG